MKGKRPGQVAQVATAPRRERVMVMGPTGKTRMEWRKKEAK